MKMKNEKNVTAAKKAWETRRANDEAKKAKRSAAAKKAWETRKKSAE
jgi:hypothetical protein